MLRAAVLAMIACVVVGYATPSSPVVCAPQSGQESLGMVECAGLVRGAPPNTCFHHHVWLESALGPLVFAKFLEPWVAKISPSWLHPELFLSSLRVSIPSVSRGGAVALHIGSSCNKQADQIPMNCLVQKNETAWPVCQYEDFKKTSPQQHDRGMIAYETGGALPWRKVVVYLCTGKSATPSTDFSFAIQSSTTIYVAVLTPLLLLVWIGLVSLVFLVGWRQLQQRTTEWEEHKVKIATEEAEAAKRKEEQAAAAAAGGDNNNNNNKVGTRSRRTVGGDGSAAEQQHQHQHEQHAPGLHRRHTSGGSGEGSVRSSHIVAAPTTTTSSSTSTDATVVAAALAHASIAHAATTHAPAPTSSSKSKRGRKETEEQHHRHKSDAMHDDSDTDDSSSSNDEGLGGVVSPPKKGRTSRR